MSACFSGCNVRSLKQETIQRELIRSGVGMSGRTGMLQCCVLLVLMGCMSYRVSGLMDINQNLLCVVAIDTAFPRYPWQW